MKTGLEKRIKNIIKYLYDENIPMESKKFYLVVGYVLPVLLIVMLMAPVARFGKYVLMTECAYFLILSVLTYLLWRYSEYRLMSYVVCFVTCFLIFPMFFFVTGYIYNGVPIFLASTVVLTFFLIGGKSVWIVVSLELVYYCAIFVYCYYNTEKLNYYMDTNCSFVEKVINFLFACLVPILIVSYQTALFNRIKVKKEQSYISIRNSELSKIRFLANMTHEIRNPMNAIVGMNELILKEDLTPGAREQAEVIRDASSQLLRIVNNILIYSKLDSNKWDPVSVKYSFRDLMRDVIDDVSKGMQDEGAEFYVFIDRTIPTYLFGDIQGIKQIFMYLLYNSIQQNQRRSMSLEVRSERIVEEHILRLKCRIAETGNGMPEADVDSLLGAFNKYDSRRNATLKGLGLEISICNELLAMMDGFLKIESVVGVGTAILFEFSNYVIDDTPMLSVDESMERRVLVYLHDKDEENVWKNLMEDIKISPVYAAGPVAFRNEIENHRYTHIFLWEKDYELLYDILTQTMCEDMTYVITDYNHVYKDFGNCRILRKPLSCLNIVDVLNGEWDQSEYTRKRKTERVVFPDARVLVVDDSLVNQKVICSLLENYEVKAKTASGGIACLDMLRAEDYDLILLDQLMPEMDGIETLRRIKKMAGHNSRIPVLCITAELGRDVWERLIDEGFDDYIAKPVKDYHLSRLLRQYLPNEMAVVVSDEEEKPEKAQETAKQENDADDRSLEIDIEKGINNVGGSEDVYLTVLNTYYNEGLDKWKAVPEQFMNGDIQLFTTNVHALKSSSASIGAYAISERFKKLEFAGKENNRGYIGEKLDECLEDFRELLDNVKEILVSKNAFEGGTDSGPDLSGMEEVSLMHGFVEELQQNLNNVNLKKCEEMINEMYGTNYGDEVNSVVRQIKEAYDMFDYHKVKELLSTLLSESE